MTELTDKTSERIIPGNFSSTEDYLLYLRHVFAYGVARENIAGNGSVLEVGSGEGYGAGMLSGHAGKIIGLDVDKNAVGHAQKKYGSDNCTFKWYDGVKFPFDDNMFDVVISFQVIEHVQDDRNYVSEIHRVLKPGGIFILTTPNGTLRIKRGHRPWNRYHVREYYPDELRALLEREFSDVALRGVCGTGEVQKIETERVKKSILIGSLDPLNLRNHIPGTLKRQILKVMERVLGRKKGDKPAADFLERFSPADYFISETRVDDSLDLLAILKK